MSVEKTIHVLIIIMVPACTSIQCTLREHITTADGVISERDHIYPRNTKMVVLLYLAAIVTFLGDRIELELYICIPINCDQCKCHMYIALSFYHFL